LRVTLHRSTKSAVIAAERYWLHVWCGYRKYASEIGISLQHLWLAGIGTVFTCPAPGTGHPFEKADDPALQFNVACPVGVGADGRYRSPGRGRRSFHWDPQRGEIVLGVRTAELSYLRRVRPEEDGFEVWDAVEALRAVELERFHLFNLPLLTSSRVLGPGTPPIESSGDGWTIPFGQGQSPGWRLQLAVSPSLRDAVSDPELRRAYIRNAAGPADLLMLPMRGGAALSPGQILETRWSLRRRLQGGS
jgi:hypothetical protein